MGTFWSVWDGKTKKNVIPPDAAQSYTATSKVAYASAKAANPQCTVLGINTMGNYTGPKWTADLLKYGATADCDSYSYHQYCSEFTGYPGDAVDREYSNAWKPVLDAKGGHLDKPVWMSEGNGHDGMLGRGMYVWSAPGKYQDDVVQISDYVARFGVRLLSEGAGHFFLYTMHGYGRFWTGPSPWSACITDDGAVHPSGAAFSAMAWELEDTRFVKSIELAKGVYGHLFAGTGRSVVAVTSAAKYDRYVLPQPKDGAVHDLFGNDVAAGTDFAGHVVYISMPVDAAKMEQWLRNPSGN